MLLDIDRASSKNVCRFFNLQTSLNCSIIFIEFSYWRLFYMYYVRDFYEICPSTLTEHHKKISAVFIFQTSINCIIILLSWSGLLKHCIQFAAAFYEICPSTLTDHCLPFQPQNLHQLQYNYYVIV